MMSSTLEKPGTVMPDGSVYAGVSPATGRPMYTTEGFAARLLFSDAAVIHASKIDAHGHKDWRVPTKAELSVLFENRAAIGGFDTTGSTLEGWYWSSVNAEGDCAPVKRFSDGAEFNVDKVAPAVLRCVRG